jgi:D-tagatose-1,6-bisphosphate aldolase subunit GatZ/KbaZ
VEFGDQTIQSYQRDQALHLTHFIEKDPRLVFEAHSTDYQTRDSLQALVEDHYTILKVGPEFTFAYREAIFALEQVEKQLLGKAPQIPLSNIRGVIDEQMCLDPRHWEAYYTGSEAEIAFARVNSYSDRIRYYWSDPIVEEALRLLFTNLEDVPISIEMINQHLPIQALEPRVQKQTLRSEEIIAGRIHQVLKKYSDAVGW